MPQLPLIEALTVSFYDMDDCTYASVEGSCVTWIALRQKVKV